MIFETPTEFSHFIESVACKDNIDLIDALLKYCDDNMIEPSDISNMINKSLRDKLEVEFQKINYLPQTATLDFV